MAPWHARHFKLKELEKTAQAHFCPETDLISSGEGCAPCPTGKEHPHLRGQQSAEKNPNTQGLLSFPSYYTQSVYYAGLIIFLHDCLFFSKPIIKVHRSVSLGLHSLIKVPVSHQTNIKNSFLLTAVDDDIFSWIFFLHLNHNRMQRNVTDINPFHSMP